MRELEYPLDSNWILLNRRKIKRHLLEGLNNSIKKRVAILGGSTTASIREMLDLFLLNQGIEATFFESAYNRWYEDAVFSESGLYEFGPDIIYICTSLRNVQSMPSIDLGIEEIEIKLNEEFEKYKTVWNSIKERINCPVIQNNFEFPFYRILGNKDASDPHGIVNYVTRLNLRFYEWARIHDDFFICDINYLSADYGLREWSDPFYWYMYKSALNANAVPYLSFNVANIIKSIYGRNKKGLVLDLDNTLWGGVVGDDGADGIEIGEDTSEGQAYSEFQRYLKAQSKLGILLCVDSKNDEENAAAGLSHKDNVLHADDFAVIKANWNRKDENLSAIADEIGILSESLVFIDDNPAERDIVVEHIDNVSAPDIGKVHEYILNIDRNGYFEATIVSDDDKKRIGMYRENAARLKTQRSFKDYDEYLKSLEMQAEIDDFQPAYYARIAQLVNKSNQFNLTAKRFTQAEIERMAVNDDMILIYGRLSDKFGDNGLVSVVIGEIENHVCHIILWLMSCRVLKRGMEFAMMDELVGKAKKRGVTEIRGYYCPTSKNGMVRDFYQIQGFDKISSDDAGKSAWSLNLGKAYKKKNAIISITGDELR